jgi:hypothetical protein
MSDTDLIRRGDVIREIDCGGCYGSCANPSSCQLEDVEAIRAIPAVDPLADPRVNALVEALNYCIKAPFSGWTIAQGYARAVLAEIEGGKG